MATNSNHNRRNQNRGFNRNLKRTTITYVKKILKIICFT